MHAGAALVGIFVIALVGLGYLVGRGPSDARRVYLLTVSGVSLLVLALAVVTALFGIVEISLPGTVGGGGGRGALVQRFGVGPAMDGRRGVTLQVPGMGRGADRGPVMGPLADIAMKARGSSSSSVRSAGLVKLLRGIIVALVAGAIFRYHWPLASESAPEQPAAEPAPRRRKPSP